MSHSNIKRVGKTWWQIAYQGWILPKNEGNLSGERVSPDISCVYSVVNICRDISYCHFAILYVLCRIWWYWRDVLVLRHDSKRETD